MIVTETPRGEMPLAGPEPPVVAETGVLSLKGLPPGAAVAVEGLHLGHSDAHGRFKLKLAGPDSALDGAVGLVEVAVDGIAAGEVEVVAGKIRQQEYDSLRTELRAVWAQLLFDPDSFGKATALRREPDAVEIWARIAVTLEAIQRAPGTRLEPATIRMNPARLRTAARATPQELARAGLGLAAELPTVRSTSRTPENALLAAALRRLLHLAERQVGAGDVVRDVRRVLANDPFVSAGPVPTKLPHAARTDARYRRVLTELRAVTGALAELVEGPGALRLGLRGLPALYEYWVFLQVLHQVAARFGPPAAPGFAVLALPSRGGGQRAEISRGTAVRFPGGVVVVYEPVMRYDGAGVFGLELVRSPLPGLAALQPVGYGTPDVLVMKEASASGHAAGLVIDAKYTSRHLLDSQLAVIHARYGRVRQSGVGLVRHVVAATPHAAPHLSWAGCSALQFRPAALVEALPLELLD